MSNSYEQGFEKVRTEENYVFIGEELSALHEINKRPCDIAISGKWVFKPIFTIFKDPSYNTNYAYLLHQLQYLFQKMELEIRNDNGHGQFSHVTHLFQIPHIESFSKGTRLHPVLTPWRTEVI